MRAARFTVNPQSDHAYRSYDTDRTLEDRWSGLSQQGKQTIGVVPNQCPLDCPPDWFDRQRFARAQALARRNLFSLNMSHLIGNVLLVLLPEVLVPIAATGSSGTAYQVLLRVLSTVVHINAWYEGDPFEAGTRTHASLMQVRRGCHLQVTRLLNAKYPDEKQRHAWLDPNNLWLSQYDMAMTQWSLIGMIGALPDQCAFYLESALEKVTFDLIRSQSEHEQTVELVVEPRKDGAFELIGYVRQFESPEVITSKIKFDTKLTVAETKRLYELQEFMYLWRVLGHCMGVHEQFNVVGQQCFVRNMLFLRICLDRGYRSVLSKPNALVNIGLQLVNGLFLALSCIIPSWLITYEGFMKYWYDALRLSHDFRLSSTTQRFSHWLTDFTLRTMLRMPFLYRLWSKLFFWLLDRLLKQVRSNEQKIRAKYDHHKYQVLDSTGIPFQIENKLYKSNV
jgi:hypothetical protein